FLHSMTPRPPLPTLVPYTTLFRSCFSQPCPGWGHDRAKVPRWTRGTFASVGGACPPNAGRAPYEGMWDETVSRTILVASTMFRRAAVASGALRVFRPQSGLTHTWSMSSTDIVDR